MCLVPTVSTSSMSYSPFHLLYFSFLSLYGPFLPPTCMINDTLLQSTTLSGHRPFFSPLHFQSCRKWSSYLHHSYCPDFVLLFSQSSQNAIRNVTNNIFIISCRPTFCTVFDLIYKLSLKLFPIPL